ncbi:hypothetical protein AN2V17_16200 [Vallitalea sp. AN17-2]|uniref:Uncharacterized protein n=1 Tax=Vallitalea maricola TaxID=3074433 RepID=A0ACB5UIK6_9FIRM|nr:hypothetical protein AN2V17_16200 [Vallitalea sp. AN17-2]
MNLRGFRFWVGFVSIIIFVCIGMVLLFKYVGQEPDLSFLNLDNMLS